MIYPLLFSCWIKAYLTDTRLSEVVKITCETEEPGVFITTSGPISCSSGCPCVTDYIINQSPSYIGCEKCCCTLISFTEKNKTKHLLDKKVRGI